MVPPIQPSKVRFGSAVRPSLPRRRRAPRLLRFQERRLTGRASRRRLRAVIRVSPTITLFRIGTRRAFQAIGGSKRRRIVGNPISIGRRPMRNASRRNFDSVQALHNLSLPSNGDARTGNETRIEKKRVFSRLSRKK